ncbi:MAG: hypothetical protein F2595_04585, partial [Actinobacteria bacterium]|nr:hypothetical protein [Actinomycetota bacterium]
MTAHPLARIQIPAPGFAEPSLYVRHKAGQITDHGLQLPNGTRATFDTAFGAFASGRWSRLTAINDLAVTMKVTGKCMVELIAYSNGADTVIASSDTCATLECADIRSLSAESFYVAVTALEDNVIVSSGVWSTST